jgi:hypothetical protein
MSRLLENEIRGALSRAAAYASGLHLAGETFHIPARHAAASVRLPEGSSVFRAPEAELFGSPLIQNGRMVRGWLLFDFSDAFYDALVRRVLKTLPAADHAPQEHAVNRMLVLSRHGGSGCPRVPSVQRALLLCILAHQSRAAYARAARAAETMLHPVVPYERPALLAACGELGDACARLLYAAAQR